MKSSFVLNWSNFSLFKFWQTYVYSNFFPRQTLFLVIFNNHQESGKKTFWTQHKSHEFLFIFACCAAQFAIWNFSGRFDDKPKQNNDYRLAQNHNATNNPICWQNRPRKFFFYLWPNGEGKNIHEMICCGEWYRQLNCCLSSL